MQSNISVNPHTSHIHHVRTHSNSQTVFPAGMISGTMPMGDASLPSTSGLSGGSFASLSINDANSMSMLDAACDPGMISSCKNGEAVAPLSPDGSMHYLQQQKKKSVSISSSSSSLKSMKGSQSGSSLKGLSKVSQAQDAIPTPRPTLLPRERETSLSLSV